MTVNYATPLEYNELIPRKVKILVGKVLYLFLSECEELFQTIDINLLINGYHFVGTLRKFSFIKIGLKKNESKNLNISKKIYEFLML